MRVETYKCDVCGQMKGENNHWFRVDTSGSGLELHSWNALQPSGSTVDLCSDQCVIKTVQQWLTAQAQLPHARLSEVRIAGEVLFPRASAAF